MKKYMLLRHQLLSYLYSENWKCHYNNTVLCRPMYYEYPDCKESYELPNQYYFGEKLIVSPITSPCSSQLGMGKTIVWLPEKNKFYYDFFTGMRYRGGRKLAMLRSLDKVPVLVEEGTIIPLIDEQEATKNGTLLPNNIELKFFAGDNGTYSMYEDDGVSMEYSEGFYYVTKFEVLWGTDNVVVKIMPENAKQEFMPHKRKYVVSMIGVTETDDVIVKSLEEIIPFQFYYEKESHTLKIEIAEMDVKRPVTVCFPKGLNIAEDETTQKIFEILSKARIEYELKEKIYRVVCSGRKREHILNELLAMEISMELLAAISEILLSV